MDKMKICEAMYALPGEIVVRRRKPLLVPAGVLVAGAALLVLNGMYGASLSNNFRSALVLVGGALALVGMILLAARCFSAEGAPYYRPEGCYLLYEELYFEPGNAPQVAACVTDGDVRCLLALPRSRIPAVTVAVYRTPDCGFAAMQAFTYADLEYRPLTGLRIVGAETARNGR